jgi:pectate lyase
MNTLRKNTIIGISKRSYKIHLSWRQSRGESERTSAFGSPLILKLLLLQAILVFGLTAKAQTLAFPGAEGFGAYASGGKGGDVYHVTNLADGGEGSFRNAVSKPNRTVVFDVSGVIKTSSRISVASNITIAGQTAPGEGISVYGNGITFSHQKNVIVRYIRFRGGINMGRGTCTLTADSAENMIFDHVSIEWGRWDNLHIKHSKNITLQHSIIGEAIDPQRFGALLERPEKLTIHHCLWIDNQSRNPKAKADMEFINNVIYNWGGSGFVGGHSSANHHQDLINNYFIAGPNSSRSFLTQFSATDHVYQSGNVVDLNLDGILNGTSIADSVLKNAKATLMEKKQNIPLVAVNAESAADAYKTVLASAGASLKRDSIDRRLISYLKSLGKAGQIVWTETQAGGHPKIASQKPEQDTDHDGISDTWEKAHKLNPNDAADGQLFPKKSKYTNLELYLNDLVSHKPELQNAK